MQRILMILEVSQKQNYIFAPKSLKENMHRSANIARVTSSAYFAQVCPADYREEEDLVYSGGGHTVLQFDDPDRAQRFARAVTRQAMTDYPGLELFVRQMAYQENRPPKDNLNELSRQLEIKKSRRDNAFRTLSMGIEAPVSTADPGPAPLGFTLPAGWSATQQMESADEKDNFLAIVHIDGNAMGARVQEIYKKCDNDWNECRSLLDRFSREINTHYREAFDAMARELADNLADIPYYKNRLSAHKRVHLPLRKVIGAGDDVCFITSGRHGLACAASFLRHLSGKMNSADGKYYTACAGVVLVHKKYPFRQAYDLSEELCRNAKLFCTDYGVEASVLDFHVEYSQLKSTLEEIRADYLTDDGARLELRPLAVRGGEGVIPRERTFGFHMDQLRRLMDMLPAPGSDGSRRPSQNEALARSKVKSLRPYLHQGAVETEFALKKTSSYGLLKLNPGKGTFFTDDRGVERCLYFDTIELLDVTALWKEEKR